MKLRSRLLHVVVSLLILFTKVHAQVAFPLKISADKRYLVDQKNKPFPILGRTAWYIVSQTEANYKMFLDNTIAKGYNAIEFSLITHWPNGNHAPFNAADEIPFLKRLNGAAWDGSLQYNNYKTESPDLTTPNEKYWAFADKLIDYCEAKGIAVLMFPGYVGYSSEKEEQGWMKELVANGEKTIQYGAWVANRYKGRKNIIWMLLGDKAKYNEEEAKAEAALIKGLKSAKGQQSILYTAESGSGENAADNPQFGHEMNINGCYSWDWGVPIAYLARKAYAHDPVMPAFLLEEPYDEEGPDGNNYNPNSVQPVRKFQYWGWLNTIGGYVSGNGYVWQFVDPIWQQHLNTQGAMDMARLNTLIKSLPWWKLIPSGLNGMKTLIKNENNTDTSTTYISAAATKDGSLLVAYIPPGFEGSVNVDVSILKAAILARWLDPTTGKFIPAKSPATEKKSIRRFKTPGANSTGENDWVLVLTGK